MRYMVLTFCWRCLNFFIFECVFVAKYIFFSSGYFFLKNRFIFFSININSKVTNYLLTFLNENFIFKFYNINMIKRDYLHFYFFLNAFENFTNFYKMYFLYNNKLEINFYYTWFFVIPLWVFISFYTILYFAACFPLFLILRYLNFKWFSVEEYFTDFDPASIVIDFIVIFLLKKIVPFLKFNIIKFYNIYIKKLMYKINFLLYNKIKNIFKN